MNEIEEQRIINAMTNWQRNQWAKAGYRKGNILKYVNMVRPSHSHHSKELLRRMAIQSGRVE